MSTMGNPYAPPQAAVRDIAGPYIETVPADRMTRLGAAILDSLIFGVMVYAPMFLAVFLGGGLSSDPERRADGAESMAGFGLILMMLGLLAWSWLTIMYLNRNGQSIAKKLLDIKVVRSDGSPVSLGRVFWLRNFVNGLLSMIPLYGLIDILFIFGESEQCLHDKIADTIVIKA
jgi:uncharacterized RDD family membrane protein YckC